MDSLEEMQVKEGSPIMKVPDELWAKIFLKLDQKDRVNARAVWKRWRHVVDFHCEFAVAIHDEKTDLNRISDLRINDLQITRLLEDRDILAFPGLLKKFKAWGLINPINFQRIMRNATAIEELSLSKFPLEKENLLGDQNLAGFSSIKILELLGFMCTNDSAPTIAENLLVLLTSDMPNLERLAVNFHSSISIINQIAVLLMEFVSRRQRLKSLAVTLVPVAQRANAEEAAVLRSDVIQNAVQELLKGIQLSVLRITTVTKDLAVWYPLLNAQTELKDLRLNLNEGGLVVAEPMYSIGIPFQSIQATLLRNVSTLVSVELKELRLSLSEIQGISTPLDARVFRDATNLKRLILCRNEADYNRFPPDPEDPSMLNLQLLPASIEALEISYFSCQSDSLEMLVDNLQNLKVIKLANTGSVNGLGVHGGIVHSIAEKSTMQRMSFQPINSQATPAQNRKLEEVIARLGVNFEGDEHQFYFDFCRFRNGIPQPRLPTVESTFVLNSFPTALQQPVGNLGAALARELHIG